MSLYLRERRDPSIEEDLRGTVCLACGQNLSDGPVIYFRQDKFSALHAPCAVDWIAPLAGAVQEYSLHVAKRNDARTWTENKILGDFAEGVCRQHLEAIGYRVQGFGIEHTASAFVSTKDQSGRRGSIPKPFASLLSNFPDFLATRICPNTSLARQSGFSGKPQALFVQVKYVTDLELDSFGKSLLKRYSGILSMLPEGLVFYVVARNASRGRQQIESHVFTYHPSLNEWRACGIDPHADILSLCTSSTAANFNVVYEGAIVKALGRMWGSVHLPKPLPDAWSVHDSDLPPPEFMLGACRDAGGSAIGVIDSCLSITDASEARIVDHLFGMDISYLRATSFDSAEKTVTRALEASAVSANANPAERALLLRVLKCIEEARYSPYGEFAIQRGVA